MTSFGTLSPAATSAASVFVESALPADLAARATTAIAAIANTRLITAINLAGGGDGHTFVVEIESALIADVTTGGLVPSSTQVQCYMAAQSEALALARSRVSVPSNRSILDEQLAGASQGTRFMGLIVETTAAFDSGGGIQFSLNDLRIVDTNGDVGNIVANGGLLASNSDPILRADAAQSQEVSWAAGSVVRVMAQTTLPVDFDGRAAVTVDLFVYTGNTSADAATFTVQTSWDGGALVSDTATDATPAAAIHMITATIAAADIPDAPSILSLYLTPAAHATDPVQLVGYRINYKSTPVSVT